MVNNLLESLIQATALCRVKYGNLDKEVNEFLEATEELIKGAKELKVHPLSVYIEKRNGDLYYLALHANGAIIQYFSDKIEPVAIFLKTYPELFQLSNAAYRCDYNARLELEKLGIKCK